MFREAADGNSPRQVKTSFALQFLHRIIGLDLLNFGIWSEQDPLDLAGLRRAQERLVARLFELLPPGVTSVLDVGCGTGAISERLLALGYDVEGLSPDPYHGKLFTERLPDRRFHLGRFQEFEPDRRYDVLFLCESAQYVWLDEFFDAVRRSLAPGGCVLLCDYFTVDAGETGKPKSGHPLDDFLARAEAAGLVLETDEDVTFFGAADAPSRAGDRGALRPGGREPRARSVDAALPSSGRRRLASGRAGDPLA